MKDYIKRLNSSEKGKTLLKLYGYLVFLVIVILFIIIAGAFGNDEPYVPKTENSASESEIIAEKSYLEKQSYLLNNNYNFIYTVSGEVNLKYTGSKQDNIINGYKESKDETIKYKIYDNNTYLVKLDKETPYNELYLGLDDTLFDFNNIFSLINSKNTVIDRTDTTKNYTYTDISGYNVTVYTDSNYITKINITNSILNYTFEFNYEQN